MRNGKKAAPTIVNTAAEPDTIPSASIDADAAENGEFNIDLDALRLPQDFETLSGVRRAFLTIKVQRPDRQAWVRTYPDPTWSVPTQALVDREDREVFLVAPALQPELAHELVPMALTVSITRQNNLFIWPLRIPGSDGKRNDWHTSAMSAAQLARSQWVRVSADMGLGAYAVFTATGNLPDPEWPALSRQEIYNKAFKDRFIRDFDHPVLKKLRGEA